MIFGLIAALCGASVYPIIFLLNGRIAKTLVYYEKNKTSFSSTTILYRTSNIPIYNLSTAYFSSIFTNFTRNFSNITDNKCGKLTKEERDFDGRIKETVNYFVLLGFVTLILQYIAHVTWNISCERQTKKMRYL